MRSIVKQIRDWAFSGEAKHWEAKNEQVNQQLDHFAKVQHYTTSNFDYSVSPDLVSDGDSAQTDFTKGNNYRDYKSKVDALVEMYEGRAEWGCFLTGNLVGVLASFISGTGVKVSPARGETVDSAAAELEYIKNTLDASNFSHRMAIGWAEEAELEGKFCVLIDYNGEYPSLRHLSWSRTGYDIKASPDSYNEYVSCQYTVGGDSEVAGNDTSRVITVEDPFEFHYTKFGGRNDAVNYTPPKLGMVIDHIKNLDRNLRDLRQMNHLYSSPTPWLNYEEGLAARDMENRLRQGAATGNRANWKLGKLLITSGCTNFELVTAQPGMHESLIEETKVLMRVISANTGIPVHFLGLPDLMSNRSTAENLMQLIDAATKKHRKIWADFYQNLMKKILDRAGLDPSKITVDIGYFSAQNLEELVRLWLPLAEAGLISMDSLLSQIPVIDPVDELQKLLDQKETLGVMPNEQGNSEGGLGIESTRPIDTDPNE